MRGSLRRAGLLASVSVVSFGLAIAAPSAARAQDSGQAPPEEGAAEDENGDTEIIVTGIRASLQSAAEIKRNAEVIVDSITAQDIGALPDRSVSEALQRVPGITLQRTNEARDPARLAAEGGGVFVRGLNWTRSELNGRDMFSANSGRAIGFEDISADLVAGIDVYKNPSADMIEGSIAGIIDLRTRKPFDQNGQLIAASIDYNYADMRKKGYWSGNALYSNRWNLGDGEIGLLLSYSLGNIGNRTDSIQTGRYEDLDNNGTFIPASLGWRRIDWQQKRETFNGSVQLRPSDELLFTFEGTIAKATPKDIEYATLVSDYAAVDDSYTFDGRGVLTGGTIDRTNLTPDTRYGRQKKITRDLSWNVLWTPDEHWTIEGDVQRVHSTADVLSFTVFTQFGVAPFDNSMRPTFNFDLSGDSPSMSLTENGASLADPANYWWAAAMDHIEDNEAGSWAERLDIEYEFADDSFFKSFRAGVRATQRQLITRQTGYNWSLLSQQFWGSGGGAPVYLDEDPGGTGLPGQAELFPYANFFRGDIASPGALWFPSEDLVSNGTANAYDHLRNTLTSGWGWVPLTEADYANQGFRADNVTAGIIDQKEKTKAAYALLRFGAEESPLGAFDGNIGVRVVETKNTALGQLQVSPITNVMTPAACVAANGQAACQDLIDALNWAAGATRETTVARKKYTNVLPSLNLRFHLTDELQLRLAAAKAIYRPRFDQMVPFNTYNFTFRTDGFTLDSATISGGNPFLEPIKSNQFDVSLEWYFAPASSLTFAAFYKDIKDYVFAGGEARTVTRNGTTISFTNTGNSNGEEGTIKGFEVGYQQFFDFLPGALSGFGVQANYTFVDSTGGVNSAINTLDPAQLQNAADQTLPLEGLSKHAFNIAALYEKYGISARLAYNWRSEYLLTTSAANLNVPTWSEAYGQLDGSILYSLTDNVKIGVQATNILNSRTFLDVGGATFHPRYSWTDTDRRIAFLLRTRF